MWRSGVPVVIAYITDMQGANGATVVGARVNIDLFISDVVDPAMIPPGQFSHRIRLEDNGEDSGSEPWSESLAPGRPICRTSRPARN
jgi:hypothetical protein